MLPKAPVDIVTPNPSIERTSNGPDREAERFIVRSSLSALHLLRMRVGKLSITHK
jgi:hypothetical protein